MPRPSWKRHGLGLWLLLLSAVAVAAQTPAELDRQVIWADAERTEAMLIPQALLASKSFDDLSLSPFARSSLQALLGAGTEVPDPRTRYREFIARRFQRQVPDCELPQPTHRHGGAAPESSLAEQVMAQGTTVLGRLVAKEPALDVQWIQVETLYRLQISEVIRDESNELLPGSVVEFALRGGTLQVEGRTFCTPRPGGQASLEEGTQLILVGNQTAANDRFVHTYLYLVVTDEAIQAPSFEGLQESFPMPLHQLRSQLKVRAE